MIKESDAEIWKDIDGFEGLYEVSSHGRVRNKKNGRILDGRYDCNGYKQVAIKGKNYRNHRLVALAFIPNPQRLPQVDHRDENKGNNDVSNLRWVSASENIRHSRHKNSCQVKQFDTNGILIKIWDSFKEIERETGYSRANIRAVCKGKRPYSYGFRWEYCDPKSQRVVNRQVIVYKRDDYIGTFANAVKASEALGLKYGSVNLCLQGRLKSNKGYVFKYLE